METTEATGQCARLTRARGFHDYPTGNLAGPVGYGHWVDRGMGSLCAVAADRGIYKPVFLPAMGNGAGFTRRPPSWLAGGGGAGGGRAHHRPDGALRLRAHPGPRHPRGDRGDPDPRQPGRAPGGAAQAALGGDFDRLRRAVRRRRPHHHDRRRVRLAHRPALPPHRAERKTLLVAGAAAGMSATFAAPVAAVLLAVELLLFEWKPRSLIPVALASVRPRRRAATCWAWGRCSRCRRIPRSSGPLAWSAAWCAGLPRAPFRAC